MLAFFHGPTAFKSAIIKGSAFITPPVPEQVAAPVLVQGQSGLSAVVTGRCLGVQAHEKQRAADRQRDLDGQKSAAPEHGDGNQCELLAAEVGPVFHIKAACREIFMALRKPSFLLAHARTSTACEMGEARIILRNAPQGFPPIS